MNWRTKIVDQYNYDSLMFSRGDAIGQLSEMDAVSNNLRAAGIMTDEELVARAVQASGARPIIITVLPVDRPVFPDAQSRVKALDAEIRGMAKKQGVTLLDAAGRFLKTHPLSALFRHADGREDAVHPSDAGYRLLARLATSDLDSPVSEEVSQKRPHQQTGFSNHARVLPLYTGPTGITVRSTGEHAPR